MIRREHWEAMRAHVSAEYPQEACGLLAGQGGTSQAAFPIGNELVSPTHFRMDAKQQLETFLAIERAGWQLLAIYHSHPAGPPHPSQRDLQEALYPGVAHLIWSKADGWTCLAYSLDDGRIQALEYQRLDE
ncbi:MAG: M67 family metallopeptidase [Anaerolineales bacterium]